MESLFQKILDKDEKLIKTIKPNKLKFFFTRCVWAVVVLAFFVTLGLLTCLVPDESGRLAPIGLTITVFVAGGVITVALILCTILAYKNRVYAYTNKRILIRHGVVAPCFKSMEMEMLGAINVHVSLFDKVVCRKTGTISFGSLASPISQDGAVYTFAAVADVYDLYKEIKEVVITAQEKPATNNKKYLSKKAEQ